MKKPVDTYHFVQDILNVTKFVKDGVMIPRFCVDCNSFFGRMHHHLPINHELDKSDNEYVTLLNHSREETERFLEAPMILINLITRRPMILTLERIRSIKKWS